MTEPVDIGWAAPLTGADADGSDGIAEDLRAAVAAGVGAALRAHGLADAPVRIRRVISDEPPHLVVCGAEVRESGYEQRQAFGLSVGAGRRFAANWEKQWVMLGVAGCRARFAGHWARLVVGRHPDLLATAVLCGPDAPDVSTPRGRVLEEALRFVLTATPYSVAEWRLLARSPDVVSTDSFMAALSRAVAPLPCVVDLRANPADIRRLGQLLHEPQPGAVARLLAHEFGVIRASLLPQLRAVRDDDTPPDWVQAYAGGRPLGCIPLPPVGTRLSFDGGEPLLFRPDLPSAPLSVGAGPDNAGYYLGVTIRDLFRAEAGRLLSSRSVGRLLDQLRTQWDPDVVAVLRAGFSDEAVTVALRNWVDGDQRLSGLSVLLHELAATEGEDVRERTAAGVDAARRRLAPP